MSRCFVVAKKLLLLITENGVNLIFARLNGTHAGQGEIVSDAGAILKVATKDGNPIR